MDLYDDIYYSLIGDLAAERALPWVPNAFETGGPCDEAYRRIVEARDRVLEKREVDEDPDLEIMLQEMDTIQRCLCRKLMELRRI